MPSRNKTRAASVEALLAPCLDDATAVLTAALAAHGVTVEPSSTDTDAAARFAAVSAVLAEHADHLVRSF